MAPPAHFWSAVTETLLAFLVPAHTDVPRAKPPRNASWWPV
jgi:hypothetical protein